MTAIPNRLRTTHLSLVAGLLGLMTAGCSGPAAPTAGQYRAVLSLRGGEIPLPLTVVQQGEQITLEMPPHTQTTDSAQGMSTTGTTTLNTQLTGTQLQAKLPSEGGTLTLRFTRSTLQGDLRFTDPKGQAVTLPVSAELANNTGTATALPWRFVKEPSSDNADISGDWQLEAVNPDHFNVPVNVHLVQTHDQVDGVLITPQGQSLTVLGQVHGDEVYLSTLGNGRAVLLKGKVNTRGELQGESWVNLGTAHPWVARRVVTPEITEPMQPVVLPWSVPHSTTDAAR